MSSHLSALEIAIFTFLVLIPINIFLIRWVFRINDIIFYLDKINEKLLRMEHERSSSNE
jgi:hypothetical protein